jgi:hypothetical protein
MEIRGWTKILALVVASAFGGAMVFAICVVAFLYYFSEGHRTAYPETETATVHGAPPIRNPVQFLGSHGSTNGKFDYNSQKFLEAGPGRIVGTVTAAGNPVAGLRLRLALNGSVYSQWGETGSDGKYSIAVPYGEYRVDGYRLDHDRVDELLGGKTENRRIGNSYHDSLPFKVSEGKPGQGVDLDYVEAIQLTGPTGEVSVSKPVVASWKPYPGAMSYRVQLTESKDRVNHTRKYVFPYLGRPEVLEPSIDLTAKGATLHPGYYYEVEVEALDGSMAVISSTGMRFGASDFRAVD